MNTFALYLVEQLVGKLFKRRVVVWYDAHEDFAPFIEHLRESSASGNDDVDTVELNGVETNLTEYEGSFWEVRMRVEPLVRVDVPDPLLIYVPGRTRDREGSLLMELELAGECYEPQLRRLARNVLREYFTDGDIDDMLATDNLTYGDVVAFAEQGAETEKASILKVIFRGADNSEDILAAWLADEESDSEIRTKGAEGELYRLTEARLGLGLEEGTDIEEARAKLARYVLVNQFRSDIAGDEPETTGMIPEPRLKDQAKRIDKVVAGLRSDAPQAYAKLAREVESQLGLSPEVVDPSDLGMNTTFPFEEKALLKRCDELIAEGNVEEATNIVEGRDRSFWVDHDVQRQVQWDCVRLMCRLAEEIERVQSQLSRPGSRPDSWVDHYTREDGGWCELDLIHRTLEARLATMDEDCEAQKALMHVRDGQERLLHDMAEGFSDALQQGEWTFASTLPQTRVYPEVVERTAQRTAYFVVDALRYEMGLKLTRQLRDVEGLALRPAVASLPTITTVGMAALMPGASASFSVIEHKGDLAVRVEDSVLAQKKQRIKHLKANEPDSVDVKLDTVLQKPPSRVERKIGDASLVLVHSQEIDALGEMGSELLARQVMDTIVGNVARAVRKLAGLGIERFVITSDHGYQFARKKGEHMRTDNPGGDTVKVDRRCWVGRGGKTPTGTVRVSAVELGYDSDLEFIFPTGLGVLSAHGGLSYHHGGCSLQEMVIPVISFQIPEETETKGKAAVTLDKYPDRITTRTLSVELSLGPDMFAEDRVPLRVILMSDGEQMGEAGMAQKADYDQRSGCVMIKPGTQKAKVTLLLTRDECENLTVKVLDPDTDAVLATSNTIPVELGI